MERLEFILQVIGMGTTICFFIGVAIILWDIIRDMKEDQEIKS